MLFKKTTLVAAIGLSLVSGAAFADSQDVAAITTAQGVLNGAIGAMQSAVTSMEQAVGEMITGKQADVGEAVVDEIKAQETLQANLAKTEIQAKRDLMVAQQAAEAKRRAIQIYGDQGTDSGCNDMKLGSAVAAGRQAMASTAANADAGMEQRSRNGAGTAGSNKKTQDLLSVTEDKITVDSIYPKSGTLTPDQKTLVSTINQHIIDPFPPNKISERVKSMPMGQKYEAVRLTYEKTKAAPRHAQNDILSMKSPDFAVNDWAKDAWAEMGNSGDPEGTDPTTKKMSYDAFLALFVRSRVDNDKWFEKATKTMNDVWQLRQINLNTAMSLEIHYRKLKLLEYLVELQAQTRANDIDKEYGQQLDELLKRAESAQ